MTLDLPFVTAPTKHKQRRVGTKATGILSIPIYGCLQVGEVAAASDLADGDQAIVVGAKLAQRISVEQKISILEAFQVVEDAAIGRELSKEKASIRLKYLPEIAELTRIYINAGRERQIASVTALVRHRLDRPAWAMTDTAKLPQPLMEALYMLFEEERASGSDDSGAPPSEEELKKSQPGTGNQTD